MFAPPFRRASPSPGPSSVQWFLLHAIVIGGLIGVASTSSSDICGTNFSEQIHTIGPVDGDLWAITKNNWTVYKLTPCKSENDSLVQCMKVGSSVSLDSKWPELAKSVKEAANKTDYDLTFDNSVIGYSSDFKDTVLALHLNKNAYFGFLFGSKHSVATLGTPSQSHEIYEGTWISSDVKGKVYRILGSGKKRDQIELFLKNCDSPDSCQLRIGPSDKTEQNICKKDDVQLEFSNVSCTTGEMTFNVSRGVLYRNQFYLFGSDKVYILLDKSDKTKLVQLSYETFFPCKKPTTTQAPLPSSNQTSNQTRNPQSETVRTQARTTRTATSGSKLGMIVGLIILAIAIIVALICTYFYVMEKRLKAKEQAITAKMASKVCSTGGGKPAKSSASASKAANCKAAPKAASKRRNPKAVRKAGSRVSSCSPRNSTMSAVNLKNGSSQKVQSVKPNSSVGKASKVKVDRFGQRTYFRQTGQVPSEAKSEKSEKLMRVVPLPTPDPTIFFGKESVIPNP